MRLRLSEDDCKLLLGLIDEALGKESDPERDWKLSALRARLSSPSPGRPRALNMERLSDEFYSKRSPPS